MRGGWVAAILVAGATLGPVRAEVADPVDYETVSPRELARVDPFVVLVEAPRERAKPRPPERELLPPAPPPAPPPLTLEVAMVASAPGRELALIRYQGREYLVQPGWTGADEVGFDGRFAVKSLEAGMLVVEDRLLGRETGFPF